MPVPPPAFDWTSLIGPALIAAVVSGVVALIVMAVSTRTTIRLHSERLKTDGQIAERKAETDLALAERKLALDRSLADWKRRTELAEDVLSDFYRARDIFTDARRPFSMVNEGSTRPGREAEKEDLLRYRDAAYAPFERLSSHTEFFATMNVKKFRFMALFGRDAEPAFIAIVTSYHRIKTATTFLIALPAREHNATIEEWEKTIGWSLRGEDSIAEEIDKAVATIERACLPWLDKQVA